MIARRTQAIAMSLAVLFGSAAFGAAQQAVKEHETITLVEDEVDDGPKSLAERVFEVDAVIRCRVESGRVRVGRTSAPAFVDPKYAVDVFTEQVVAVIEVVKPDKRLANVGERLSVAQPVGEAVVGNARVRRDTAFEQFAPGQELVLFLNWNQSRGMFSVLPSDAFSLKNGRVAPNGLASYATREDGRDQSDFLTRLRAMPMVPKPER